jgi:hypothetical protein
VIGHTAKHGHGRINGHSVRLWTYVYPIGALIVWRTDGGSSLHRGQCGVTLSMVRGLICVGMVGVVSVVRHEGRRCLKVRQLKWRHSKGPRRVVRILMGLSGGHCGSAL